MSRRMNHSLDFMQIPVVKWLARVRVFGACAVLAIFAPLTARAESGPLADHPLALYVSLSGDPWLGAGISTFDSPDLYGEFAFLYRITLDTSSLLDNPAGPFFIDFQFNDGEGLGDGNNSVTLTNFSFGGGEATGTATNYGGTSGDLFGAIHISDTAAFNGFTQSFVAGTTFSFDLTIWTANLGAGGIPDLFTFALLHSSDPVLGPTNIPTTDAAYQLFTISLDPDEPIVSVYTVDVTNLETPSGIAGFAPEVTQVPEPSSALLLSMGVLGIGLCTRRLRR